MPVLTAERVTVSYAASVAVENVSFSLEMGESVCLVGGNGAGKSSLLKAVFGLLKPQSGVVRLHLPTEEAAYLPQCNAADRDFPATVQEVVLSGRQRKGRLFYSGEDRAAAAETMHALSICTLRNRRLGTLSGGQLQRALLARALCAKPRLLVLDEPCAGLDAAVTRDFYQLLSDWRKANHLTIFMASHDLDEVEKTADRVLAINRTLRFDGKPGDWAAQGRPGL